MKRSEEEEEQRLKLALQKKYNQRITIAKNGRELFLNKEYLEAAKKYQEYLFILAKMNEVEDIFQITPAMFDEKKDVTEMLLISHVFWELSRIYEMTPKLQSNFQKCLDQFIRFTTNQPFQVLNAEMLRKYIKKNQRRSPQIDALNTSYQKIFTESKKCFIATYCFGDTHHITRELRLFKRSLIVKFNLIFLVRLYYSFSPKLIKLANKSLLMKSTLTLLSIPTLRLTAFIHKFLRKL